MFALGFITGLLVSVLIVATLTYFKRSIETKISVIERVVENAGPKAKGFIVQPPNEAEEVRARIIEKNRKEGKDTPIQDLM